MSGESTTGSLRVLCVSPLFLPLANPEALCGGKMVLALMEQGVEVQVLCDPRYLEKPGARRDASPMWDSLDQVIAETDKPTRNPFSAVWQSMGYRSHTRWAHVAVRRACELHAEKPFDLVYSRSLPMQAHVVGYWCSRTLGIPWVANINDPWDKRLSPVSSEKPPRMLRALLLTYWLKKTLRETALVTFPSRRLGEQMLRVGGVKCRMAVIPHVGGSIPAEAEPDVFRIIYAGLLGLKSYRLSADGLFVGMQRLFEARPEARKVTRMTFLGPGEGETLALVRLMGIEGNVESLGRLPFDRTLEWMGRSSVCLLVESPQAGGIPLPSKLAHYISARKPVLSLSLPSGTVADMCPDSGLIRVDPDDAEGIGRALQKLYDAWKAGTLDKYQPSAELVQRFDAKHVAGQFLSALGRVGIAKRP